MRFRLVPNSVTLDDLERRKSPNRRVILNSVAFGADYIQEAHHEMRQRTVREFFYDDIVQVQNIKVSNEAEVYKNSKIRLAIEFENNNE